MGLQGHVARARALANGLAAHVALVRVTHTAQVPRGASYGPFTWTWSPSPDPTHARIMSMSMPMSMLMSMFMGSNGLRAHGPHGGTHDGERGPWTQRGAVHRTRPVDEGRGHSGRAMRQELLCLYLARLEPHITPRHTSGPGRGCTQHLHDARPAGEKPMHGAWGCGMNHAYRRDCDLAW